jgi:hypothetical protein
VWLCVGSSGEYGTVLTSFCEGLGVILPYVL